MRFLVRMFCLVVILLCLAILLPVVAASTSISMSILGKQEQIRNVPVVSINENVPSLPDRASGTASGKRQHKVILVTKESDATSPQLMRAEATNELLKEVVFEFSRSVGGKNEIYRTLTLTNAQIVHIERKGSLGRGKASLEEVSFACEEIRER